MTLEFLVVSDVKSKVKKYKQVELNKEENSSKEI